VVKEASTEFSESMTNGWVSDTRQQMLERMHGRTGSPNEASFFLLKEILISEAGIVVFFYILS